MKFSYGKIKTEYETVYAEREMLSSDGLDGFMEDTNLSTMNGFFGESDTDYFGTQLDPGLTYFVTDKFGVFLGLGGIKYSLADWESNNSDWSINFNPSEWSFGIKFKM